MKDENTQTSGDWHLFVLKQMKRVIAMNKFDD